MDEMFDALPTKMIQVLMHEAEVQVNTIMKVCEEAFDNIDDLVDGTAPEEDKEAVDQFLTAMNEANNGIITAMYIHGFLGGAGYIFRIMSLLDCMAEYLTDDIDLFNSNGGLLVGPDGNDDDDTDRAGMPKDNNDGPVLGKLSDDTIHDLISGLSKLDSMFKPKDRN